MIITVKPKNEPDNHLIISYLTLRKVIGYLGIGLPIILAVGKILVDSNAPAILESVSQYYYTEMRDVFVGVLVAVSVFLFSYNGYDPTDNALTNLAGLFALGVAFFPTSDGDATCTVSKAIHYISAALFFLLLSAISFFQFTRSKGGKTPEKIKRNRVYRTSAVIMVGCLMLIAVYWIFIEDHFPLTSIVFWLETAALWAFGISWLVKGKSLLPNKS